MLDMNTLGFFVVNIDVGDSQVLRDMIYGIGFRHGGIEEEKDVTLKFYVCVDGKLRFKLKSKLEKLRSFMQETWGAHMGKSIMRRNILKRPRTYGLYPPYCPRHLANWDLANFGSQGELSWLGNCCTVDSVGADPTRNNF